MTNKKVISLEKKQTEFNFNGLFDGCLVDNIVRSLSGQNICKNVAGNTQIQYAKANGKGWNSNELRAILAEQILLLLISKSTDTQTAFGTGRYSGGSANANNQLATGQLINRGAFHGDKDNGAVKVFHRENPWGNIWKIVQGLIAVNGKLYVKFTPGTADGSTADDYTDGTNAEGYIDSGITLANVTGGYINGVSLVGGMGLLPDKTSGSSSTFIPDGVWVASGTTLARFGSDPNDWFVGWFFCVEFEQCRFPFGLELWRVANLLLALKCGLLSSPLGEN